MNHIEPLDKTNYIIMFGLLFILNLVNGHRDLSRSVCHVQSVNLSFIDSIGFPHLFDLIGSSLTTCFNSFHFDQFLLLNSISFIWFESYDWTQLVLFGDLNMLSLTPYSL